MTPRQVNEMLENCASKLGEHFDAVEIMVSRSNSGVTEGFTCGCGNFYARQGMAQEFVNSDMAMENAKHIAKAMTRNDTEDGDEWKQ